MSPAVLVEKPQFGIFIGLVASHWNKFEQSLSVMYTWLLNGQEPSAFEFYHDLIDMGLREKAFMAAAKGKLDEPLIEEVRLLYAQGRKLAKRRAKVIHGTWCSTESKPDAILLCDPKAVNEKLNDLLRFVSSMRKGTPMARSATRIPDYTR
jgi:hypothetical protein